MNDATRTAMRNSFNRVVTNNTLATNRLSAQDLSALSLLGLTGYADEPAKPILPDDLEKMLAELASVYSKSKLDDYLDDAQDRVLKSIVVPFGLGKLLTTKAVPNVLRFDDKKGGNVTTVNNARQGHYADEDSDWNPSDYRKNFNSKGFKDRHTGNDDEMAWIEDPADVGTFGDPSSDVAQDMTTGKYDHPSELDVDHTLPLKKAHDDGLFMLPKENRVEFGDDERNFRTMHKSANRSKGCKSDQEWQNELAPGSNGQTQKEKHNQDNRRCKPANARAQKAFDEYVNNGVKFKYYTKNTIKAGAKKAGKMGLQQALGAFLLELARAMMAEIRDVLSSGIYTEQDQTFIKAIAARLKRIGNHVISKWKEIVAAFRDGAIGGFMSTVVDTIIHIFAKSARNIGRLLREGSMSLWQGFNCIFFHTDEMTKREAYHEASKILIGGISVGLGITAEEAVEKSLITLLNTFPAVGQALAPFVPYIVPVIVGIAVGLGTSLLCYMWDKLDLFRAEEERRHKFIMDALENQRGGHVAKTEASITMRDKLVDDANSIKALIEQMDLEVNEMLSGMTAVSNPI